MIERSRHWPGEPQKRQTRSHVDHMRIKEKSKFKKNELLLKKNSGLCVKNRKFDMYISVIFVFGALLALLSIIFYF